MRAASRGLQARRLSEGGSAAGTPCSPLPARSLPACLKVADSAGFKALRLRILRLAWRRLPPPRPEKTKGGKAAALQGLAAIPPFICEPSEGALQAPAEGRLFYFSTQFPLPSLSTSTRPLSSKLSPPHSLRKSGFHCFVLS